MVEKKVGESHNVPSTEEKRLATHLVVAEWYVLEKSLIQETICEAERCQQSP
jgi:hypothetical protein